MSAPQRKGCRGTLTRFRNPAAAPVLRWVIGEIRPARVSSRRTFDRFRVEVSNSVEWPRAVVHQTCLVHHTCVAHPG